MKEGLKREWGYPRRYARSECNNNYTDDTLTILPSHPQLLNTFQLEYTLIIKI